MKLPAVVLLVAIIAIPSALLPAGLDRTPALVGRAPYPAFSGTGDLAVLFRDGADRLALAGFSGARRDFTLSALSGRLLTDAPVLKRDGSGRLWAAWAEESPAGGNEIRLARVAGRRAEAVRTVRIGADFPASLDLAFDRAGRPWLAFIIYAEDGYEVRVLPPGAPAPVAVAASNAELACLRLVAAPSRIRAFWVQDERGRSEIRKATILESGAAASVPAAALRSSSGPIAWLQAAAGPDGTPWIVWSGYDGEDYEIRAAPATETGIGAGDILTFNRDQDLFPALAFLPSGEPLVVWHRPGRGKGLILARRRSGRAWSRELLLASTSAALGRPPGAVAEGGRIGLAWEDAGSVRTALIELADLNGLPSPARPAAASASPLPSKAADLDDAYMGFGDSITYGVIDNQDVPERGYIPRLEALLRARFGAGSIVNEGWPGEITVNGMGRMKSVLAAHPVGTLLLMEGTNDVIFSEFTMSSTAFHLERMAAAAREAGVYIVMATIIPRNDWRWGLKFYRDRIFNLNDMIRALALNLRLPCAEHFNAFFDYPEADGGWQSLLSDKVHPTDKGYEILTQDWFGEISRLPFKPASPAVERTASRGLFLIRPVNRLTWGPNPRLFDSIILVGYNVYRSEDQSTPEEPSFLARYPLSGAAGGFAFIDASIDPARRYRYRLRAVRRDGVEGPPTDIVRD
jgi:lysophospholipase L1-like esterase